MRLRSKITAFLTILSLFTGLYFFTLPQHQLACAQATAPQCTAVGGSCTGQAACEGPLNGQIVKDKDCTGGSVCCRYTHDPVTAPLPIEAQNQKTAGEEFYTLNKTTSNSWTGQFVNSVGGEMVLNFTGGKPLSDGKGGVAYSSGALGNMGNLTAALFKRPVASSTEYIADVFQTIQHPFGEQTAYAQGLGFSALNPVLALWKLFRNLAYFFYVIIFMVVGLMIMLRQKIGGQAAVTVQQMLPKLIVSLLLVTFSYAIAGLMLDIMYISIYLMIGIFQVPGSTNLSFATLSEIAFQRNIFTNGWNLIAGGVAGTVSSSIGEMVASIISSAGVADVVGKAVGGATNIVVFLVIAVALLVNLFRIFFTLLTAYASIFISVIFAPIQLLLGVISGGNTFMEWVKGLAKHIAVFPTVILLIFIANFFAFRPGQDVNNPTIGGLSAPQLGTNQGAGAKVAFAMLQFAILALIPKAAEIASGLVDGKLSIDPAKAMQEFAKQGNLGKAVGVAGLGAIGGAVGGAVGGGAIGAINAARAKPGERLSTFVRDTKRGALVGTGGGVIAGGGLQFAQKGLKTVGEFQRNIKSVNELQKGVQDARTQRSAQTALNQKPSATTTPIGGSPSAGSDSSEN